MKKFSDFIREEEMHELKMHPQHKQIKKYADAKASDTFKRRFGALGDGGPEGDTVKARAAASKNLRKLKKPLAKTGMTKAANKIAKKSSDRMINLTRQDHGDEKTDPSKKFTNKQRRDQMKSGSFGDANDKYYRGSSRRNEETESLEELKQSTMKSYIGKAQKQVTDTEKFRDYQNKSMGKMNLSKADKDFVNKKMDKDTLKRRQGIKTAMSKMNKEETFDEGAIADKAKKSGISAATLRKVYNRGMAAWKTGHRPGTTPQQWGHARVNAFITKKKKGGLNHDKDLA